MTGGGRPGRGADIKRKQNPLRVISALGAVEGGGGWRGASQKVVEPKQLYFGGVDKGEEKTDRAAGNPKRDKYMREKGNEIREGEYVNQVQSALLIIGGAFWKGSEGRVPIKCKEEITEEL